MYDDLLVAVDPTGCAQEVVAHAVELARRLGARVHLLHVTRLPAGVHAGDIIHTDAHPDGAGALSSLDEEARRGLEELAAVFRHAGVEVHALVRHGEPAEAVLRCARDLEAGLIVLGTHGRTGLERLLVGSVAEEILRHAQVPVMTVRTKVEATHHPGESSVRRQLEAEADG